MNRVNPSPGLQQILLDKNSNRCCVCKRRNVGLNFHHIDGDSSNTIEENLAVLCVEDHDYHHRPNRYLRSSHHELSPSEILSQKVSWEGFVAEANKANPNVIAVLASYGTPEYAHSFDLVFQWPNEKIEYNRLYHLHDGDFDKITDMIMEEVNSVGNIKLAHFGEPFPIEHCPCCSKAFSRTLKYSSVKKHTSELWDRESFCGVYINQEKASLAFNIRLRDEDLVQFSFHLCNGNSFHLHSDDIDEVFPINVNSSIRSQAEKIVLSVIGSWNPAITVFASGNPDNPTPINAFILPSIWEIHENKKVPRAKCRNRH